MTQEPSLPIFDRKEAAARIGDDHELLQSLVEMFIAECAAYLDSIDAPYAAGDWPGFARGVHTLKGVLATLSANRAHAVAERLDRATKAEDRAVYAELLAELKTEIDILLAEFKR